MVMMVLLASLSERLSQVSDDVRERVNRAGDEVRERVHRVSDDVRERASGGAVYVAGAIGCNAIPVLVAGPAKIRAKNNRVSIEIQFRHKRVPPTGEDVLKSRSQRQIRRRR